MPLTKVEFAPGLVKDESPLASEGAWTDADKVRFVNGRPQIVGGWQAATSETFEGVARGAHAWATLTGHRILAWGTATKLYAMFGGTIRDITPPASEGVIVDPFTTFSGSSTVTVTHPFHGLRTGQAVTFANQSVAVGGLTLNGSFTATVIDHSTYQITAAGNASSSATGGGAVDYLYALAPGLIDGGGEPGGYGTGGYGEGGYGGGATVEMLPRVWFLDNWGETLLALPRGGALYQYQPARSYPNLITNGGFDTAAGWTTGVGWSIGSGVATAVAGAVSGVRPDEALDILPGYVYRVTATVTRTSGTGTLTISSDAGTLGDASVPISVSGTYSRRFRAPAGATYVRFEKDIDFAGTIDDVSLTLESVAYRVDEAPYRSLAMFIDPHQIVVLLGTTPQGGADYNAMAVSWSDRQNLAGWVPSVDNLAGDDILSMGSRLIAGRATRQQNLIWSDAALYTMQYTSDATTPFIFALSGTGCGIVGALAHAEHDGTVFWVGNGRFYLYNGAVPAPIPCRIERDVFDNIAENQHEKIVCGVIPKYSEARVLYPDKRDGNECSRYADFRWDEGHWTAGTFARSGIVKPGIFEYPIMFGTDGVVYEHEAGSSANGGTIDAFIESSYFDAGDGENLVMIRRIVGDFDDLQGHVAFTLSGRMWPTDTERSYGPFTHVPTTRKIDLRMTARQIKMRLASCASPLFWRMGALRLDVMPLGAKR